MSREELEKLTTIKLRELAHEYPEITGAIGLKKEELVVAILKARGEPIKQVKKDIVHISKVKKQLRTVKQDKEKALSEHDAKQLKLLRKQIKKLKRQTRQIAGENKQARQKDKSE